MSILMWCILWYLCGLLSCFVLVYIDLKKGMDYTLGSLFLDIMISILGPFFFIVILYYLYNILYLKTKDKILIKGDVQNETKNS